MLTPGGSRRRHAVLEGVFPCRIHVFLLHILLAAALFMALPSASTAATGAFEEANQALFAQLQSIHHLSDGQMATIRAIFAASGFVGQGNPAISQHPTTPAQCLENLDRLGVTIADPAFEAICGGPFMAPLYDPESERPDEATACIDQLEFPDIPCAYPVVWVRAREAAQLCDVMGKRLCDAHEWEGACAGQLREPDYRFDLAEGVDAATAVQRMRKAHNAVEDGHKVWSYGPAYRTGICAAGSHKTAGCEGGGWNACGSNTYPAASFPECRSPFGVYDLHGNAAEHMNLPLAPEQMASFSSTTLGVTEMKGSWFIFDTYKAHEDACRWRAPFWHGGRVMDSHSHHNYHLGFRCCKTISSPPPGGDDGAITAAEEAESHREKTEGSSPGERF